MFRGFWGLMCANLTFKTSGEHPQKIRIHTVDDICKGGVLTTGTDRVGVCLPQPLKPIILNAELGNRCPEP